MAALEHFAQTVPEDDPVFWICSFAVRTHQTSLLAPIDAVHVLQNNQHSVELGSSLEDSPFEKVCSCACVCAPGLIRLNSGSRSPQLQRRGDDTGSPGRHADTRLVLGQCSELLFG